jgi:hypothetical protein
MKVKAIYRDPKANPFALRPKRLVIRADVSEEMTKGEIEALAKEATPKGHEFVKVVKEESLGHETDL